MRELLIFLAIIVLAQCNFVVCMAEKKVIFAEGKYILEAGTTISAGEAKIKARKNALKIALDKAGIYVETYSRVENFKLTADEMVIISGEIAQVDKIEYNVNVLDKNSIQYSAFVTATIDTKNIQEHFANKKRRLAEMRSENVALQSEYNKSVEEGARLKAADVIELSDLYVQLSEKEKTPEEILELTGKILSINPAFKKGTAYYLQAEIYSQRGDYAKALECDLNFLEYNPGDARAYFSCAQDYCNLRDWDRALEYINKAITLEPENLRYLKERKYINNERRI